MSDFSAPKAQCTHTVVGPFSCNCHLLVCPRTGRGTLIDPGDEPEKIARLIADAEATRGGKIEITHLLHTHGHLDHIAATAKVKAMHPGAVIALHGDDEPLYKMLREQGRLFGMNYADPLPVEHRLSHGESFSVGELRFTVIHHPGHSPGSLSFRLHEDTALGTAETVYCGDTLFRDSVGRTDLWGADGDLMFRMIRDRLLTLDGDTAMRPGHGDFSTIGREKRVNPFLR